MVFRRLRTGRPNYCFLDSGGQIRRRAGTRAAIAGVSAVVNFQQVQQPARPACCFHVLGKIIVNLFRSADFYEAPRWEMGKYAFTQTTVKPQSSAVAACRIVELCSRIGVKVYPLSCSML